MIITVDQRGESLVAVVEGAQTVISNAQDALDLMTTARYDYGCDKLALPMTAVSDRFFDLRSGLAGEVLQKFANYRVRIALVGDFSEYEGRALGDFIRESNKGGSVLFLPTLRQALDTLHGAPGQHTAG